jgi:hypothetical protein
MYSADSGVDGLAELPEADETKSVPDEVAEDATDCLRCVTGSRGDVSMAKKLADVDGQPKDIENGPKSSSSSSVFGVDRMASIISAILFVGFREGSAKRKDVCFDCVNSIYSDLDSDREHTLRLRTLLWMKRQVAVEQPGAQI